MVPVEQGSQVRWGPQQDWTDCAKTQSRVIGALMIRDLRTRFAGGYIGYSIAILWPMAHFGIILAIYMIVGRSPSYGTGMIKWIATGALPFIAFLYPVRFIGQAILDNSNLLAFPAVRSIDIMISRIFVESLTTVCVCTFLLLTLFAIDRTMEIADYSNVLLGLLGSLCVGIGFGVFSFAVVSVWPKGFVFLILLTILVWATMGIFFLPDSIPQPYNSLLALNPVLHAAERLREGFYPDYRSATMDYGYLYGFSAVFFLLGLAIDRFIAPLWRR